MLNKSLTCTTVLICATGASSAFAATIGYDFESGNASPTGPQDATTVYTAPDTNDFGAGVTVSAYEIIENEAAQYGRFGTVTGTSTVVAAATDRAQASTHFFEVIIDDTVIVDLTNITFDSVYEWTGGGAVDDVYVDFSTSVDGGTAGNVSNFDWNHDGAPDFQRASAAENLGAAPSVNLTGLTGLTDTTVRFTWTLDGDRSNNFGVASVGLDDIVLTGTVQPVPEPGSLALIGLGGLMMIKRRRR